jgi:hypothetical protein
MNKLFSFDVNSSSFVTHGRLDENGRVRAKFDQWRIPYQPGWFADAQWMQ